MYPYHCTAEFLLGTDALRRISRSCQQTCDKIIIKLLWDSNIIDIRDQPPFQDNNNWCMEPITRINNKCYIVKLKRCIKKSDKIDLLELKETVWSILMQGIETRLKLVSAGTVATSAKIVCGGDLTNELNGLPYFHDEIKEMACYTDWLDVSTWIWTKMVS